MTRDALLGARLLLVFVGVSLGSALLLVLLGASSGAGVSDNLQAGVLTVGAAFGGRGSIRFGNVTAAAIASPLLISVLSIAATWCLQRRRAVRLEWVGAVAVCGGLMMYGLISWANGWHGVSVDAGLVGVTTAAVIAAIGMVIWTADRWPVVRRPVDLVMLATGGVVLIGLATELVCGLTFSGQGAGRVPLHTEIALGIAYAPNAGVAALALGLGGSLAVSGISPEYFTFVARFAGEGPTSTFGAAHGQGDWAHALHLPGLVSVFALAPLFVLAVAYSVRWLRSRAELLAWALGLSLLLIGLSFAAGARLSVDYDGFVLGGSLEPTWWGRLAGLLALPLGLAVFMLTRSATEPRLDVGDRPRELGGEVS